MGWVLLKRIHPEHNEVILVTERMYIEAGRSQGEWQLLAQGSDAEYEMLEKMAELTEAFVELSVNRQRKLNMFYAKEEANNVR